MALAATRLFDSGIVWGAEVNTIVPPHPTMMECVVLPTVPLLEQGMPQNSKTEA